MSVLLKSHHKGQLHNKKIWTFVHVNIKILHVSIVLINNKIFNKSYNAQNYVRNRLKLMWRERHIFNLSCICLTLSYVMLQCLQSTLQLEILRNNPVSYISTIISSIIFSCHFLYNCFFSTIFECALCTFVWSVCFFLPVFYLPTCVHQVLLETQRSFLMPTSK